MNEVSKNVDQITEADLQRSEGEDRQEDVFARNFVMKEQNRRRLIAAREVFQYADFETYVRQMPDKLQNLFEDYKEQVDPDTQYLPGFVIRAVVDSEYIDAREAQYINISPKDGLYLPDEVEGGGDFWYKSNSRVQIFDMGGHGRSLVNVRVIASRAIELYNQQYPLGEFSQGPNLVESLDGLLSKCPFKIAYAEFGQVRVLHNPTGGRYEVQIEKAGGVVVFIRRSNGEIKYIHGGSMMLGYNIAKSSVIIESLDVKDEVFLASDGIHNAWVGADGNIGNFEEAFLEFAYNEQIKQMDSADFLRKISDWIKTAKHENNVADDVTIITLQPEK